jgi:hypothetical protein
MRTKQSKKTELAKLMSPDLRKTAAILSGKTRRYVNQVLNVSDKRYNEEIISICEKLVAAKEETINTIKIQIKRGGVK